MKFCWYKEVIFFKGKNCVGSDLWGPYKLSLIVGLNLHCQSLFPTFSITIVQ